MATPQPTQLADGKVLHELSITLDKYSPQQPLVRSLPIQKIPSSLKSVENMDSSVPDNTNHSGHQHLPLHSFPQATSSLQNQTISISPVEAFPQGVHLRKESHESDDYSDEERSLPSSLFQCVERMLKPVTDVELVMNDE